MSVGECGWRTVGKKARARFSVSSRRHLLSSLLTFLPPHTSTHTVTKEAIATYNAAAADASRAAGAVAAAQRDAVRARFVADAETPWFWRFKGQETRKRVYAARARATAAERDLEARLAATEAALTRGRAALGLWSEAGVGEAKRLYRDAFASGKVFARRQTFWDALTRLLRSRDDRHPVVALLELLAITVINFAIGAIGSVFIFAMSLPRLIASFQASFLSGVAFYVTALLAAAAVAASFITALAASGTAAAYGVVSVTGARLALRGGGAPGGNVYALPPRARPRAPGERPHRD